MKTKPEALQDLSLVVAVVAAIDAGRWAKLRAVEPWVTVARRRRASWADLEPLLRPLLPDRPGADDGVRALRAGQLMAKILTHKARELAAIDLEDVAQAAGVGRPETQSPQPSSSSVSVPSRVLDLIDKLADGRTSVRPVPVAAFPSPAQPGPERSSGARAQPASILTIAPPPKTLTDEEITRVVAEGRAADEAASIAAAREKMESSSRSFGVRTVPPMVGGPNSESRND